MTLLVGILYVIAGVCCIVAVRTKNRRLLVPYLLLALLACVLNAVALVWFAVLVFTTDTRVSLKAAFKTPLGNQVEIQETFDFRPLLIVLFAFVVLLCSIFWAVQLYYFVVVLSYFYDLRDKEEQEDQLVAHRSSSSARPVSRSPSSAV